MATGHYAQIHRDEATGRFLIHEGADPAKDQSYVLYGLDQDVLSHCLLPVGQHKKEEIRRIAAELDLPNADKPDSMEICFIPKNDYREFLQKTGIDEKPGVIRDSAGNAVGEHKGYFRYTIGQRRGIGLAAKEPLYVKSIHPETNEVVVGTKAEVFQNRFRVVDINWSVDVNARRVSLLRFASQTCLCCRQDGRQQRLPSIFAGRKNSGARNGNTFHFDVKIRSNHKKAPALVECVDNKTAEVSFASPQDAITPGQSAVFYDGAIVAGGGKIRL
jgi:tRNA-specific 2-thiouridylase